jgi:hypothetical protein
MSKFRRLSAATLLICAMMATPAAALSRLSFSASSGSAQVFLAAARIERKRMNPQLALIRKRLIAHRRVSTAELRRLADAGDSLGSFAFGKWLAGQGDSKLVSDALHYFAMAAISGRDYAVRPILELVSRPDAVISPAHLKQAESALSMRAARGNNVAIDGLVRLYSSARPFGAKPEEAARLLSARAAKGNSDAAYRLAMMKLSARDKSPGATPEIIRYLEIAERGGTLGVKASAANLLALLRVGSPAPQAETSP